MPLPAVVADLCLGGVGLTLGRRLEPGPSLFLHPHGPRASSFGPLRLRTIHTRPAGGGHFLGGAFSRPLLPEELRTLAGGTP